MNGNFKTAYESSFGELANNSCYADSANFRNADMRASFKSVIDTNMVAEAKALSSTTGGVGSQENKLL